MKNPVAKHGNRLHRAVTHKDRRRSARCDGQRKRKHKGQPPSALAARFTLVHGVG